MVDWANLSIFIGAVSGSLATVLYALQKSKCSHIECFCVKCERDVSSVDADDVEAQLSLPPPPPPNSPVNKKKDNSWIKPSVSRAT